MSGRRCLRCLLRQYDPQAYRETLQEHIDRIPPRDRADPAGYAARLETCQTCDRLTRGACLACGCYVELRAASKRGRCPYGKW